VSFSHVAGLSLAVRPLLTSSTVIAIVMMGDPSHQTNVSWNAGTSTHDGVSSRNLNVGSIICHVGFKTGMARRSDGSEAPDWLTIRKFFNRNNTTACQPYAPKMRSYCDEGDIYCDQGQDRQVHSSYFTTYRKDAVNFIWMRYNESVAADVASGRGGAPPSGSGGARSVASATQVWLVLLGAFAALFHV
jgi:acetylxylan esterase